MVFEAVVVELLNKFLKQYVENLDTSQLKIGIWGGDVELKDLQIKTTLFDDLNLPVRVKWGKLGKLAMKIPWKNLYASQVVLDIEELLMVVVPNTEFKYDPVKEEKWANDKKQARLKAVEEAKKREVEKDVVKQNDGFVEKLVTQIVKNIQIVIKNIHFRYEDKSTSPDGPFSVGVTMSNLSAQTTGQEPVTVSKSQSQDNFIYKEVNLEGLSIYWNSGSVLFSELSNVELTKALIKSIPKINYKPSGYQYVFGPLSASASLKLNPKPELDGSNFTIPKVFVNVHLQQIDLALTRNQFCDAMFFLKDFERLSAAAKYKKWRPVGMPVIGHAKQWWLFAYNCVAEDIKRRKKEWSWQNIRQHRKMCRTYSELFKIKMTTKKVPVQVTEQLVELEKKLNVFNLILLREQVYVEVERIETQKTETKAATGWFSGWFGSSSESKPESNGDEFVKKIESVMTVQEKKKLYKAIGYEESAPPTNYPITFVEVRVWLHLDEIRMTVFDENINDPSTIISSSITNVKLEYEERPSAFAKKLVMMVGNFHVIGKQADDKTFPDVVTSNCSREESLFEILYETKPLKANCDQRIHVKARPLRIVYHASTINKLVDVFKTASVEDVSKIMAATSASLPTFQKITAMGLQYAIEKRSILEVKVDLMSSSIIIPYGGVYQEGKDMLVLMLGKLSVATEENEMKDVSVKKLYLEGAAEKDIFSTVLSASYTNFKCELSGVQILLQLSGEDWELASNVQGHSALRFLESTNLVVTIKKSLVNDDARIPKMIIEGKLPSLAFNFSEERFVSFAALVCSIPSEAEDKELTITKKNLSSSAWSLQSIGNQLESKLAYIQDFHKKDLPLKTAEYEQGIDLVCHFEMNELVVNVSKTKDSVRAGSKPKDMKSLEEKFLHLRIVKLEIEFTSKTFETVNLLKLGGIEFTQYHKKNVMPFVTTKGLHQDYYLFVVEFVNLDPKAPDFFTAKGAVMNRMTLNITPLNVVLNKEALVAQMQFATTLQHRLDGVKKSCGISRLVDAGKLKETIFEEEGVQLDKKIIAKGKRFRKKRPKREVIDFFLEASLDEINVVIEFEGQGIADFFVKDGSVQISTRKSYTNIDFKLGEVCLQDLNPHTLHKKIVSSLEEQTLNSRVTIYNSEYFGSEKSVDMSIEAEVGGLRCTFVNLFFSRAIAFLNAFQVQVQSLKEGATVAAQKAKENVIKAYQNATQICLNVKITAPLLIMPTCSSSLDTLVVDLGVLTIKNNITELDYTPNEETTSTPIIDTMKFHLQNLKFARCLLREDSVDSVDEKTFLVPVTFELTIKRNLSTGWFRVIPQLEIIARLAAINVQLTHEDLCFITRTLGENLSERDDLDFIDKLETSKSTEYKIAAKPKEMLHQTLALMHESVEAVSKKQEESSNFYTVVKFMFFMDSLVFDAVTQNKKEDGSWQQGEISGLARLVFETISLKGRMFSDGSIHTAVMLVSCLLDDTRPGKPDRLTRLMERSLDTNGTDSSTETNPVHSMLEVIYQKKGCDTFIDVKVYKFTLILSMDFLQKLGQFFTLEDEVGTSGAKRLEKTTKTGYEEVEDGRPPTSTINLRLEKPDIIIVENMDSINADALIFNTELVMKYRVAGPRQVIAGTLNDMELYSCCFNPAKRRNTLSQVIKPFTISISGSTPENQGLHIDIVLTEILITIDPSTIELISKCYEALLSHSLINEDDLEEKLYNDLWDIQQFSVDEYWFLKAEQGVDALTLSSSTSVSLNDKMPNDEICLLAIPSIIIWVEGMAAKQSKPLLLVEMGFQSQCYNWSQKMNITSTLTLQMQYFNKLLSAWEPLIEPVGILADNEKHTFAPWQITCNVAFGDEGDMETLQPPKMVVSLTCTEILQLTFTKTCMEVLTNLADTYTSAVTKGVVKKMIDLPPYVVKNETGMVVELHLRASNLQVCKAINDQYEIVKLESNSEVELQNGPLVVNEGMMKNKTLMMGRKEARLRIKFPISKASTIDLPLGSASKRYFPIPMKEVDKEEIWGLVSDVSVMDNSTTVVLRSVLRVHNYFMEPVNIHSLSQDGTEAEYVGTAEGNSAFSVPFNTVYGPSKKLFFSINGYSLSVHSFDWESIKSELTVAELLQCNSKIPETHDPFFIQAVGEVEEIYFGNTNRRTVASICYKIHLQPTLKIVNSLPVDLTICFQGSAKEKLLQPGNNLHITNAEPGLSTVTIRINDYLEKEWSCKETILQDPSEFFIWKFVSYNGLEPETLNLGVHCTYSRQTAIYNIYCPYFMVNKTGHLLSYKFDDSSTVFYHPGDFKLPLMFSPTNKKFFSKKSAYLQVGQSNWSDKFPVDVPESGGTVECEDEATHIVYKISVSITLTFNSLTKIVLFTPFYVFLNEIDFPLECREGDLHDHPWIEIPENSCTPFWPRSRHKSRTLEIRPKDSEAITPPFNYENMDSCLLQLSHECGGIFVEIQATQRGNYITFTAYEPGDAPALIINHSAKAIKLFEKGTKHGITLNPFEKAMFAWCHPTGERKLIFKNPKLTSDIIIPLDQDTEGPVHTIKGETVRYVSFLDGAQRIVVFTEDKSLSSSITNFTKIPTSGTEIICKIQGIGVSLVNNVTLTEILYMGFVSSGIAWEVRKIGKVRYKALNAQDTYDIEKAFTKYEHDCEMSPNANPAIKVSDKIKVNFRTMQMLHPTIKELRRTHEPGLWIAYRILEDQIMLHVRINRIQIDNQLHDCIFPIILSPTPPPPTIAAMSQGRKPFVELSVVKILAGQSGVEQYKYFKILVQEFHVKIDIGFVQQFWAFFAAKELSDEEQKAHFKKDFAFTQQPLESHVEVVSTNEQKNFYDLLHFSPLKIHFSFSLAGHIDTGSLPPSFSVMLQSLGVTLTDVHDVIFRLSYFEKKSAFLTNTQLQKDVISHYYGQIVRQAYVLVLGLDVLGNPYGLIVGIGKGVEAFFYEPFQGMVQGPSEFASGVAIGCKSLFGHTVGSTAGTLGKLTETLGKGLAVLSLDKEYQIQRMENLNRHENIQASMARGGRGLVMGVFEGVTGVVTKPIEGAKEEGAGGFFKGLGKGMMGLVTRPVTGVVDFASTSLNAVKRVAESSVEHKRLRPPRFFRDDRLVEPYNLYEAQGNSVFYAVCKRKYCATDKYEYHYYLTPKEVVILTNKRMLLAECSDVFGTWQEHLAIKWTSMPDRPRCHTKGVAITLPSKGSVKKDKSEIKVLLMANKEIRELICKKMHELYELERDELS